MEQTAPYAAYVRAKIYKVDSGREEWLDYDRIVQILTAANFNGPMSMTFEGGKINECDDKESFTRAARQSARITRKIRHRLTDENHSG